MKRPVAIVGVGQTPYRKNRPDASAPELVFEAVSRASIHAGVSPGDVDAVVFGSAPEVFEGVHEPDHWCVEAVGGIDKPVLRIHTGGATGGSAAHAGAELIASGRFDSVLVVGLQRVAETADAQQIFTSIFDPVYESDVQLNIITTVAMMASRQLHQGRLDEDDMAWVSVKNFNAGARNPYAQVRRHITAVDVKASRLLATPLRLLHCCPRSDGACAVLLASAERAAALGRRGAWIRGLGAAADVYRLGDRMYDLGRDFAEPRGLEWAARRAYAEAGIQSPRDQLDVIEMYAPFSNVEIAFYEALGLVPWGQGARLVREEVTAPTGSLPVCPSGGTMTANPIGATGLVRVAEAALQVMGEAGDHQVEGTRTALATATGGVTQFFTVMVISDTPDGGI